MFCRVLCEMEICIAHQRGLVGELYVDSDVFPDDDDIQYRPDSIDPCTDWRRDEWPEGFIYACCEKNCKDPGCVVGRHISIRRRQTLPAGNCGDRRKP